ncbi:MAG: hypothetical protein ACTSQJ_00215 [Promethearchaeota archaeon]
MSLNNFNLTEEQKKWLSLAGIGLSIIGLSISILLALDDILDIYRSK